jgi:hypothetical protein
MNKDDLRFLVTDDEGNVIAGFARESDGKSWTTVHGNGRYQLKDSTLSEQSQRKPEPAIG